MIEVTLLTKIGGPLTKSIERGANGKLDIDGSACLMTDGTAQRVQFDDIAAAAEFIGKRKRDEAIALGRLRADLPDKVKVTTAARLDRMNGTAPANLISRTASFIAYAPDEPALALIDIDTKGLTAEVADRIAAIGEIHDVLSVVLPQIAIASRFLRRSTSSGIRMIDTGEEFPASKGFHLYLAVKDGGDVARFLKDFHERCWLAGFGWHMVGAGGQLLDRSIVDRMVGAGERLVFEGKPDLGFFVEQDQEARRPIVYPGEVLDTLIACPPLTPDERTKADEIKAASAEAIQPASDAAREAFIVHHATKIAKDRGIPLDHARHVIQQQTQAVLLPDAPLPWDRKEFAGCTARDIIADPARFVGQTMADPLEGVPYGRCKAKVYQRRDGSLLINSQAHGGKVYQIKEEEPPQADATEAPPDDSDDRATRAIAKVVAEFNDRYMVVREAGKGIIYTQEQDPILKRKYFCRMTAADLRLLHLNERVFVGNDDKGNAVYKAAAEIWLRHHDRRGYIYGVTFDPNRLGSENGVLNLWQGFAMTPRPGTWELLKAHIFNVICGRHQERFDYLLNWAARLIQYPAERGEVAVVLKGKEGAGKGTFANALRRILGQHALKISNGKHLTGNFNAHLRDCVFLFADEAFYAGDPSHVGVLKSLITEDSLTIEAKFVNASESPNFLHLMMASNETWVVPASLEARRFLVMLVSDEKLRNFAYFAAINEELEAGGYEAMLHDLLHHDLTGFNVRDVPDTEGLQEQKKLSLGTSESWWLDVLHRGYVYKSKLGLEDHFGQWHEIVTTEVLFASYTEFVSAKKERHAMAREAFGAFMRQMGAVYTQPRNAVIGEHIIDAPGGPYGDLRRKAETIIKGRATGYHLSTMETAREAFTNATKLPVEWEADTEDPE